MKKIWILAMGLAFLAAGNLAEAALPEKVAQAEKVVWAGLDFSKVKMIGTQDFLDPNEIFPGMLNKWNELFLAEMIPKLSSTLGKEIVVDTAGIKAVNMRAKKSQIVRKDGDRETMVEATHIKDSDIAAAVKSYKLKETKGVALVFIVDRLVKQQEEGCVYTVFFDISSRKVLSSKRGMYKANGFGFRNYWFRPMKNAIDDLK